MGETEDDQKKEVVDALRSVRDEARSSPLVKARLPEYKVSALENPPASQVEEKSEDKPEDKLAGAPPVSPDRTALNERWNVAAALDRSLSPMRGVLSRWVRFALGPLVPAQTELNSAQVRFDNEIVTYLDARLDRISAHYDHVLGLHGKRMEEIDERHAILQQELIRHVHELVKRIEFVFENAEQNHVYLDGALRELREELRALAARLPT